jgi:hypothetical protein
VARLVAGFVLAAAFVLAGLAVAVGLLVLVIGTVWTATFGRLSRSNRDREAFRSGAQPSRSRHEADADHAEVVDVIGIEIIELDRLSTVGPRSGRDDAARRNRRGVA